MQRTQPMKWRESLLRNFSIFMWLHVGSCCMMQCFLHNVLCSFAMLTVTFFTRFREKLPNHSAVPHSILRIAAWLGRVCYLWMFYGHTIKCAPRAMVVLHKCTLLISSRFVSNTMGGWQGKSCALQTKRHAERWHRDQIAVAPFRAWLHTTFYLLVCMEPVESRQSRSSSTL